MVNLTRASRELFSRTPDERFESFDALLAHCEERKFCAIEHWQPSQSLRIEQDAGQLLMRLEQAEDVTLSLSDWSFTQLCRLCDVDKETVNKLTPETASLVFRDAMPYSRKPLQEYATRDTALAVHSTSYSRLFDAEVLQAVREAAPDFTPPPPGFNGATGLYAGEQDMFAFGIDPNAWVEIGDQSFAPGFFVWNSEVGRRSVGVETFWYQSCCANHIVWDAIEVVELQRRHIGNVQDALDDVREAICRLVAKRDERRDAFAKGIKLAMNTTLGEDAEHVTEALRKRGIGPRLVEQAIELVPPWQSYSVFSIVDSLTRIAGRYENAGDRLLVDQKAASLLSLAA
jgi:GNAT superfamily N-acetyltransferase